MDFFESFDSPLSCLTASRHLPDKDDDFCDINILNEPFFPGNGCIDSSLPIELGEEDPSSSQPMDDVRYVFQQVHTPEHLLSSLDAERTRKLQQPLIHHTLTGSLGKALSISGDSASQVGVPL